MPTQKRAESDASFAGRAGSLVTRRVLVEAVIVGGQWVVDSIWFNVGVVDQRRIAVGRSPLACARAVRVTLARTVPPAHPAAHGTRTGHCHWFQRDTGATRASRLKLLPATMAATTDRER